MNFFDLIKKINRLRYSKKVPAEGSVVVDTESRKIKSYIRSVSGLLNAGHFYESLTQLEQGLNHFLYDDSFIEFFHSKYLNADTLNLTGLELEEHFSKFPRIREILFKYNPKYFSRLTNFIDYCLEKSLTKLIDQSLELIYDTSFSPYALWLLSDIFLARQRKKNAHEIYNILSKKTLITVEDYLYSGLSEHRLGNTLKGCIHLENGLKIYPKSMDLKNGYYQICALGDKIERVISFFRKENESLGDVCRKLLHKKELDPLTRMRVITFCLKNNLVHLAESEFKRILSNTDDTIKLWQLADVFLLNGRSSNAEQIYGRLSKMKLTNPTDYIYCALSNHRLNNLTSTYRIFEEGITAYPEDANLRSVYVQICAIQYNYKRYSEFMQKLYGSDSNLVLSLVDFCEMNFTSDAQLNFLMIFKGIEKDSDPDEFTLLKQHFLESLAKNSISLETAKSMLFFGKYLDIENDFCQEIFDIIKKSFENFDEDYQRILYCFELIVSLSLPMVHHFTTDFNKVAMEFIKACKDIASNPTTLTEPITDMLNNWTPWQSLFCSNVPEQYPHTINAFEKLVFATWPGINYTSPHIVERLQTANQINKKIKIGFTVHDSMPMLAGILRQLDKNIFDTVFLRPGDEGRSKTAKEWTISADHVVEYSSIDTLLAIKTIAAQKLDIIISGPSIAAIFFPMMARLASLQMVILEPNWTNGTKNTDYYISWQPAEPAKSENFYHTAVAYLEHPPYWLEKPSNDVNLSNSQMAQDEIRKRLLNCGPENRIYLCANTPPKIHPLMDSVFSDLLEADPGAIIVLLRGEYPAMRTLEARLQEKLGKYSERVIVLPTLTKEDAHSLLIAVDCCLDSFPMSGMSSSFDGAMLGVPLVTLPYDLPFGKWTAAIYDYIGVSGLTARDKKEYVQLAQRVATDVSWRKQKSLEIKEKSFKYVQSKVAFDGLQKFIIEAWNRKLADLPPGNWIGEEWHEFSVKVD